MSVPVLRTVDRALQLIELLRVHSEVTVSGAADVLGVGTSVAHRLLATLEARGFARRAADSRAYCLGPALLALRPESSDADYIAIAQDQLRHLQAATGETVHLAALHGRNVRFFYTIVSRHTMRVESRVGDLLPAHAASAGRALLATLPVVALRKLYPEPTLLTVGQTSTPTRQALETELEAVRLRGYARNVEDTEPGVAALAMAVHGPAKMPPIAVTVAGPQARLLLERDDTETATERQLCATLRRSVQAIQARLRPGG